MGLCTAREMLGGTRALMCGCAYKGGDHDKRGTRARRESAHCRSPAGGHHVMQLDINVVESE